MNKMKNIIILSAVALLAACSTATNYGEKVEQTAISRIDAMPNMPAPYNMLNWEEKAKSFDNYVFDWNNGLIWLDESKRNINQNTFGLYTAVKDVRQGKDANKRFMKV